MFRFFQFLPPASTIYTLFTPLERFQPVENFVKMFIKIFVLIVALSALVYAAEKKETVVLLDNLATRETHSIFFKNLQGEI